MADRRCVAPARPGGALKRPSPPGDAVGVFRPARLHAAACATVCGTACFLAAPTAGASNPSESLRPSASVHSLITTESSEVLPKWTPSAGVLTTYGRAISGRTDSDLSIDSRATSHVLVGFGIAGWTELSLDLPLIVHQVGVGIDDGELASLPSGSLGDLRVGLKGTILHTPRRGFGLGLSFDVTAPTGDPTALTGYAEPTYAPQILFEQRMARGVTAGVNIGYLARPELNAGGVVFGDAVTYRAGLRIPLSPRYLIDALAEMDGSVGMVKGANHPLALRGGVRWQARSGVNLAIYGGGAPIAALGVPDVQGMFAIGYAPVGRTRQERAFDHDPPSVVGYARRYDRVVAAAAPKPTSKDPADPDGDGVVATRDACPSVAEDRDGFDDDDGCPELDNDRDGIRDGLDLCAGEPEVVNGYQDGDGCPDRRLAKGGQTYRRFDPAWVLPQVRFVDDSAEPTKESIADLEQLAELLRLNPWMSELRMRVYTRGTADSARDHALTERRALAIEQFLAARGVEPWRVMVDAPRAIPARTEPRVVFSLGRRPGGLAPLAPSHRLAEQPRRAKGPVYEAQGPDAPPLQPTSSPAPKTAPAKSEAHSR